MTARNLGLTLTLTTNLLVSPFAGLGSLKANGVSHIPMAEVLAAAAGPAPTHTYGLTVMFRDNAILALSTLPSASSEEEMQIVTVLKDLLADRTLSIRLGAAMALGRRGHVEILPQLFANIDCEPDVFSSFFFYRPAGAPPIEMLRSGLRSETEATRVRLLDLISVFRIPALREDLERIMVWDPAAKVRRQAASILRGYGVVESLPAFQQAVERDPSNDLAIKSLGTGGDAQVPILLQLLRSAQRETALTALAQIKIANRELAIATFMRVLEDDPERPALFAAAGLARYHDNRALPFLRRIAATQRMESSADETCVSAIVDIGRPDATTLLNEMLPNGWFQRGNLEKAMVSMGDVNSARLVWAFYRDNPVRQVFAGECRTTVGYRASLQVLEAWADRALLEEIRVQASTTRDSYERERLTGVVRNIEQRLALNGRPRTRQRS